MAFSLPDSPVGGIELVESNVAKLLHDVLPGEQHGIVGTSPPLPIYVAGVTAVLDRAILSRATKRGWQYLVTAGESVVGAAELSIEKHPDNSETLRYALFTRGPFPKSLPAALLAAEALPEAREREYELRLLRLPAVYLVALWLHAPAGSLLLPLAPTPAGIAAYIACDENSLASALMQLAQTQNAQ